MRPAEHTNDRRDVLKMALRRLFRNQENGDIDTVDAIESLIDAKLSEQSSHAAKGEREGGDTKWWDGPRISAHEAAEDMKREAVVNAARHLHDAMVNGGGADTVKDAGEILGEALADYDEESDAACNCNPLEQTGGGHRGDCPAYEPECTCYELIGGHQPGCPFKFKLSEAEARLAAALAELHAFQKAIESDSVSASEVGGMACETVDNVVEILDPEAEARAREGR